MLPIKQVTKDGNMDYGQVYSWDFFCDFLLEIVPAVIAWQQVVFQWVAAAILGTSGGIVGQRVLQSRRNRRGYSFKEAKKERLFKLDRS